MFETERLKLRPFTVEDAPFVFTLYNDPDFLHYIGDRGVHSLDDARAYIKAGPLASYERNGFGLYVVERKGVSDPIGVCGLLKRDTLEAPDLGFAFLPAHRARGYAPEAAAAVLAFARDALGLTRILAITSPDNARSMTVLRKLGFELERLDPGPIHVFRLK